jgi:hypothetical protein
VRTKVTLVLLFLNVALFFFIFGFEREWRIREEAQRGRNRVLGSETSNIQALEISGPNLSEPIRLRRQPDTWMLTSPVEWPADHFSVSRILHELQFLEHHTSFAVDDLLAAGQGLADYGLETPALTVTFTPASPSGDPSAPLPSPIAVAVGAETPVGNRLYILSPDRQRVHVVDRSLADTLRVALDRLRADTCFTIPGFEIRSLNLQTAGPANARVRLRREGNRWWFEAPINARANKMFTELAINDLTGLTTHTFLGSPRSQPDLANRAGTSTPSLRITLEGTNRRETLLLGERVPSTGATATAAAGAPDEVLYYGEMEDRDALFTVSMPTELLNTLRNAQEELRDRRILPLEGAEVTAISIAAPSAPNLPTLTLQRLEPASATAPAAPASWQIVRGGRDSTGPQTRPADREVVARLIQHLTLLSAQEFLRDVPSDAELENWGLTRPERAITLTLAPEPGAAAPATMRLLLGVANEREGRVYAMLAHQPFVYLVGSEILRVTPVVPRVYRDRLLRELPAGARLVGITVTDLGANEVLYERTLRDGESWAQIFTAEPPDRAAALTALRAQLRTLRAERFVSDSFTRTVMVQGEERPWAYRVDATLALTGGGGEQLTASQLFFAPRTGGATQLVGSPENEFDVVFEAEQALLDAMWVLTHGPRDPGPAAAEPASEPTPAPPLAEPSPTAPSPEPAAPETEETASDEQLPPTSEPVDNGTTATDDTSPESPPTP